MENSMEIIQANWLKISDVTIEDNVMTPVNHFVYITGNKIDEILDTYSEQITENGKRIYSKIGIIGRDEAHSIGALHIGAQIWIYNSRGQVLLQKRAMTVKSSPGLFDTSVAGHIKSSETILSGGLREISQEIGLSAKAEDLFHIGNYRRETKKGTGKKFQHNNELNKVFLLRYEGDILLLKKQKKEVSELKFITLEQLEEDWNNPKVLPLYTSKGEQYRQMIILNIKKIIGRSE